MCYVFFLFSIDWDLVGEANYANCMKCLEVACWRRAAGQRPATWVTCCHWRQHDNLPYMYVQCLPYISSVSLSFLQLCINWVVTHKHGFLWVGSLMVRHKIWSVSKIHVYSHALCSRLHVRRKWNTLYFACLHVRLKWIGLASHNILFLHRCDDCLKFGQATRGEWNDRLKCPQGYYRQTDSCHVTSLVSSDWNQTVTPIVPLGLKSATTSTRIPFGQRGVLRVFYTKRKWIFIIGYISHGISSNSFYRRSPREMNIS